MKTMYVYIVECSDHSFYTGVTDDLERRLIEHNNGISINSYTYTRRPVKLVFYEIFNEPSTAILFEKKLKGWSRNKKIALINKEWNKLKELSICKNSSNYLYKEKSSPFDSAQDD